MVSDDEVIAELRGQSHWRHVEHPDGQHPADSDYRFTDVRTNGKVVDIAIEQRDGKRARIAVALPSSGAEQPWLYAEPERPDDWMQQFLIWTDEEILTCGLDASRARTVVDGESYVIVAPYGWQSSDARRHKRLMRASSRHRS